MSPYPYPQRSYRTLLDLDLYPYVDKRELKNVNVKNTKNHKNKG